MEEVVNLICMGERLNEKTGKMEQQWQEILENNILSGVKRSYAKPLTKYSGVGQVYAVTAETIRDADGKLMSVQPYIGGIKRPKFLYFLTQRVDPSKVDIATEIVMEWQAAEKTDVAARMQQQNLKNNIHGELKKSLKPVRRILGKYVGRRERHVLAGIVLSILLQEDYE